MKYTIFSSNFGDPLWKHRPNSRRLGSKEEKA
jgi:hypothetical protein